MELGDKSKKYCVPVDMEAMANICVANIHCDTKEEYEQILDDNIDAIYDEGHFNVNCHNNFDVGDGEIAKFDFDEDKQFYEVK